MILLLLSLVFAGCDGFLTPELEHGISRAIELLGDKDGPIFSAGIRGYAYDAVAKRYGVTPEYVVAITQRGFGIALEESHGK